MARYMMLLFIPQGRTQEEAAAESPKWTAYTQELHEAGAFVAGDALQGNETATPLRVRDGETQLTDGPFAEAKEYLARLLRRSRRPTSTRRWRGPPRCPNADVRHGRGAPGRSTIRGGGARRERRRAGLPRGGARLSSRR